MLKATKKCMFIIIIIVLTVHVKGLDKYVGKVNSHSFGIFVPGIEWYMTPLFSQSFQISMSALRT